MNYTKQFLKLAIPHIMFGILVITACRLFQIFPDSRFLQNEGTQILNFFLFSLPSMNDMHWAGWIFSMLIVLSWNVLVFIFYFGFLIIFIILINILSIFLIFIPGITSILGGIFLLLGWKPALKVLKFSSIAYVLIFPIGIFFTLWSWKEIQRIDSLIAIR